MFMYRQVVHSSCGHWPSNERYTEVLTGLTSSFSLLVIEHVSSKSACTLYTKVDQRVGVGWGCYINIYSCMIRFQWYVRDSQAQEDAEEW